ncbi:FHA domain-containing protein [Paraliomyxa miuraensis]|uniref:FHA domain-containing protein n=1 Tax=Paraliomyxa miuraensis TaxID=376150 RepID=UPI00224CEAF2|nr:FHA domain-containing protein [Paraliomyxa miuraensis]MCX4245151.1 FHA domain-containing protein [Paraliomyxa miuraensis]
MVVLRIHAPVIGQEERVLAWDGHGHGRPITLGRDETCDVVLLEQAASRHHARLEQRGDQIVVVDLDSANGVWVGDERVEGSRVLHDGDAVKIGDTTIELVLNPHRQPTLIRSEGHRSNGSGPVPTVVRAEVTNETPPVHEDVAFEPTVSVPIPTPPSGPVPAAMPAPASGPAAVATPVPAPAAPQRSSSAYEIGSDPTLARDEGPHALGVPDRSTPSVYSLGSEPTPGQHEPDRFELPASSPSVYSLGDDPSPRTREPDRFELPASSASVYSFGDDPSARAPQPDRFELPASSPSVYSLGDVPTPSPRGPDLPMTGPASSAELSAPPPRPGALPAAMAIPAPAPVPAPALIPVPAPAPAPRPRPQHSAASSWEWSEPTPSHRRQRHHRAAGPTLWLGLGLLVGGIVAIIVGLASGFDPQDLRTLIGWIPGGLR